MKWHSLRSVGFGWQNILLLLEQTNAVCDRPRSMWVHLFSRQNLTTGRFPSLQAARKASSSRKFTSLPKSSSVCCPSFESDRSLFALFSFLICLAESRGRVASITWGVYGLNWGNHLVRVGELSWIEATLKLKRWFLDAGNCRQLGRRVRFPPICTHFLKGIIHNFFIFGQDSYFG